MERELVAISLVAATDLSAGQYRIVAVATDGQVDFSGGTVGKNIGVLQNKPSAEGHAARVGIGGVSKCVAGGSITAGDTVVSNAEGFALAGTGATSVIIGRALQTAAGSGDIFELLIQPSVL